MEQKNILLAEDNEVNQKLFSIIAAKLGHSVDIAADGIEVLERIGESTYDIIFMDLNMPRMDGYEAALKAKEQLPHIPIVALTADSLIETVNKCRQAGMNDVITKPFKKEHILNILKKYTTGKTD